ncbi:MAG: macro domain-containing protein, partial [bacterium]
MSSSREVNQCKINLVKVDITDFEVEAIVYYAREDLKLGAGFGNAIAVRGGATIQKELDSLSGAKTTEAVITAAGNLKAKYIIHAVGPKFQESNTNTKLEQTVLN